jgi:type IV pilus assembly protein PilQ
VQDEPPTERVVDPFRAKSVVGMSKHRISLDMREVDVANALRLFASEGGVNIIADDEVKGTVTLTVRDAPIDQVFLTMLQSLDLGYEQRGDIIRVAPREKLLK